MKRICMLLLFSVVSAHAIGYQHGIFASQSTQGASWRGTSSIIAEQYSITVMPSYLDIELDWEFDCQGGQAPDSFKTANTLPVDTYCFIQSDRHLIGTMRYHRYLYAFGKVADDVQKPENHQRYFANNAARCSPVF